MLAMVNRLSTTVGDRNELLEVAGPGGMGEVSMARDFRLDRPVAVKLLNPASAATGRG